MADLWQSAMDHGVAVARTAGKVCVWDIVICQLIILEFLFPPKCNTEHFHIDQTILVSTPIMDQAKLIIRPELTFIYTFFGVAMKCA